jgi:hypothetical protein
MDVPIFSGSEWKVATTCLHGTNPLGVIKTQLVHAQDSRCDIPPPVLIYEAIDLLKYRADNLGPPDDMSTDDSAQKNRQRDGFDPSGVEFGTDNMSLSAQTAESSFFVEVPQLLQLRTPVVWRSITAVFSAPSAMTQWRFYMQHLQDFNWRISERDLISSTISLASATIT